MTKVINLFLLIFILLMSHNSLAQVEWFEPRQKLSSLPNSAIVTLIGKTEPGSNISVNPNSVIVIQYANKENNNFSPRIYNKPVTADAKGFFYYPVLVPFGLTQLTIELSQSAQPAKPVLITMRVDKESVNLNVKVTRTPKIIKIKERTQKFYEFSLGISPLFQSENVSPDKSTAFSYTSNTLASPFLGIRTKLNYWQLDLQTGLSDMKLKNQITEKTPPTDSFNFQWIRLGGNYRWKETSSVWMASEVSWHKKSMFFLNKSADPKYSFLNIYRFGIGFEHLYAQNSYILESEIKYHVPFAVKVDKGEIVYNPEYILTASSKYTRRSGGPWDWGFGLSLESNVFNIQYKSSIDNVDTKDQRNQLFYSLDLFMIYRWSKSTI